jgi:hypothetical protein
MLFFPEELRLQLGAATIDSDRAEVAERVVWGWLKPVLGLTERPYPVPDEVFSWAIELGAIAHENPAGLSSKQLGPAQQAFSMERRREILADAAGGGSSTAALSPRGSFPDALSYPDGTW